MKAAGIVLLVAAVAAGLLRYPLLTPFLKVFVWILLAGLYTEVWAWVLSDVLMQEDNSIASNLFVLCETGLSLYAASLVLYTRQWRQRLIACGFGVGAAWVAECCAHSIFTFNNYSLLAEYVCLLPLYVLVMYRIVLQKSESTRDARFWLSIGVVINAGCNIPFFCLYHYLIQYSEEEANRLYQIISIVAGIQSVCCIVAFILYRPAAMSTANKKIA